MRTLLLILLFSSDIHAQKMNIMTFNTMCDVCKGSSYFEYAKRVNFIQKTVAKLDPDIISFQEIRLTSQVDKILKGFPYYAYTASNYGIISYADPAIVYNKNKFRLIEEGNFWLGPKNGDFTLGWKFALPRQVQWVKLELLESKKIFYFLSSHFDNRIENLTGAAIMVNKFARNKKLPVIFAADTNLTTDMPQYDSLVKGVFHNAFDLKVQQTTVGQYKTEKDLCYSAKGSRFPECRVDHILLSQNHTWSVYNYIIDVTKDKSLNFASDHRAVMAVIEI